MRSDYCPIANEPCQSLCDTPCSTQQRYTTDAMKVRQAVAQAVAQQDKDEPVTHSVVAGALFDFMGMPHHRMVMHAYGYHTRAWVALTKEEKQQWIDALPEIYESKHLMRLLDIMEARLKEANT